MNLEQKILQKIKGEFSIEDTELLNIFVMKRKETILKEHINNVCKIYAPTGNEGAKRYWMTKLTPTNRAKQQPIYAKTEEELNNKIIAFYLKIENESKHTMGSILALACENLSDSNSKRIKQFFYNNIPQLEKIKIANLTENDLEKALRNVIKNNKKKKNFSGVGTALNKIYDYCNYNKIQCINIKEFYKSFKAIYLNGKRVYTPIENNNKVLAFDEKEAVSILKYAIDSDDFKTLSIAFLITTGLRVGELLALKPTDIYIQDKYIRVERMIDIQTNKEINNCKDNSVRNVILNQDSIKILNKVFDLRNKIIPKSDYLFLNDKARYGKLTYNPLDRHIRFLQKDVLKFSNKNIRSCHDCRRTYASIQYLKLGDKCITIIQKQLGHKTPTQTWEYIKDIVEPLNRIDILEAGTIL